MIDKGHDVKIYSWGLPEDLTHEAFDKYNLRESTWYPYRHIPNCIIKRLLFALSFLFIHFFHEGFKTLNLIAPRFGAFSKKLILPYVAERFVKEDWTPDVIISHFGDNAIIITALKAAGVIGDNVRTFAFFHAHELCRLNVEQLRKQYNPMFMSDDILLPISEYWKKKLLLSGALESHIKVFRMGIDPNKFSTENGVGENEEISILSVGRLVGQKGYEYAIRGFAKFIKDTNLPVKYRIIGTGELANYLKGLTKDLEVSESVDFLGAKTQRDVIKWMKRSHIFLLPSVTDDDGFMEGIPVALMEAMAMGLIPISTYHSGIPELIKDKVDGFLCEERNPDQITKALAQIIEMSTSEIEGMKRNGRARIESDYNINKLSDNLDHIIRYGI